MDVMTAKIRRLKRGTRLFLAKVANATARLLDARSDISESVS